jgi:hypothetical protein
MTVEQHRRPIRRLILHESLVLFRHRQEAPGSERRHAAEALPPGERCKEHEAVHEVRLPYGEQSGRNRAPGMGDDRTHGTRDLLRRFARAAQRLSGRRNCPQHRGVKLRATEAGEVESPNRVAHVVQYISPRHPIELEHHRTGGGKGRAMYIKHRPAAVGVGRRLLPQQQRGRPMPIHRAGGTGQKDIPLPRHRSVRRCDHATLRHQPQLPEHEHFRRL